MRGSLIITGFVLVLISACNSDRPTKNIIMTKDANNKQNIDDQNEIIKQYKKAIGEELKNSIREDVILSFDNSKYNNIQELYIKINGESNQNTESKWIKKSWKIAEWLFPGFGWLPSKYTEIEKLNKQSETLKSEIHNAQSIQEYADNFYLKRQFSSNEWELVIMSNKYTGNAVFRCSNDEVAEKNLEGKIIRRIALKYVGKEPFTYSRYNNFGKIGESTEYLRVYELPDYDVEDAIKTNKNITAKIIELNNELKNTENEIRKVYDEIILDLYTLDKNDEEKINTINSLLMDISIGLGMGTEELDSFKQNTKIALIKSKNKGIVFRDYYIKSKQTISETVRKYINNGNNISSKKDILLKIEEFNKLSQSYKG